MKLLFDYLRAFPIMNALESVPRKRKADEPELWSGHRIRAMLHLLFVVSLLCLLRSDEGLRIMWSNVTFETTSKGKRRIKLMLPFRKNRQDGGGMFFLFYFLICVTVRSDIFTDILPFYLYALPDRPWLCPVRAFASYMKIYEELGLSQTGYVFRKKINFDTISSNPTEAMV